MTTVTDRPTECDARLLTMAVVAFMPRLTGPGVCGIEDAVELRAVLLADGTQVAVMPPALLRCPMAESFSSWLRDDVAPQAARLGSPLHAIENDDSYECRTRNGVRGATLSEHARGNAIDLRALRLADGRRLELTDVALALPMRVALRESACRRFGTVLGPSADHRHDGHIHLDMLARRGGYRICEWDLRRPPPAASAGRSGEETASTMRSRAFPAPLPLPRPAPPPERINHSPKL
ncbi:MAG: extensin family protein [Pseudolabrys sp.]|nr:extensin family protein [Pseudolabrys sp.]